MTSSFGEDEDDDDHDDDDDDDDDVAAAEAEAEEAAMLLLLGEKDATLTTDAVMDAVSARNADAPILMASGGTIESKAKNDGALIIIFAASYSPSSYISHHTTTRELSLGKLKGEDRFFSTPVVSILIPTMEMIRGNLENQEKRGGGNSRVFVCGRGGVFERAPPQPAPNPCSIQVTYLPPILSVCPSSVSRLGACSEGCAKFHEPMTGMVPRRRRR